MAPTPYLLEDGPVEIHTKRFNEDAKPVRVRVNAWVWFAMEAY